MRVACKLYNLEETSTCAPCGGHWWRREPPVLACCRRVHKQASMRQLAN